MPAKPLTKRQKQGLRYIEEFLAEHDRAPTLQELSVAMGFSRVRAHEMIGQLIDKGWLERTDPKRHNSLRIVPDPHTDPRYEICPNCHWPLHRVLPQVGTIRVG